MLCMNDYPPEYVRECRARVDAQLAAYRQLIADANDRAAIEAFEPVFFNNMVIVLDGYFTHRSRTLEKKDGNPLNEVRMLCTSMMGNGGVLAADKQIRLDPGKSILGYRAGDEIRLTEAEFVRLADAFFAEIEEKFVAAAHAV
ncbi:MAG: hypothetical protein ACXVRD_09895 [Gaiellaceae bacterium]